MPVARLQKRRKAAFSWSVLDSDMVRFSRACQYQNMAAYSLTGQSASQGGYRIILLGRRATGTVLWREGGLHRYQSILIRGYYLIVMFYNQENVGAVVNFSLFRPALCSLQAARRVLFDRTLGDLDLSIGFKDSGGGGCQLHPYRGTPVAYPSS
jgi:hypothetical protein